MIELKREILELDEIFQNANLDCRETLDHIFSSRSIKSIKHFDSSN